MTDLDSGPPDLDDGGLLDLADWLEETWPVPYKGKTYRIPAPSAELGLRIEALMAAGAAHERYQAMARAAIAQGKEPPKPKELPNKYRQLLTDEEERDLYQDVLGPAWDELVEAGMPWPLLKQVAIGAMIRWHMGEDAADAHLRALVSRPNPPAAGNRASRRAASKRTAAATTTKPRASTSGTTSRRISSRATPPA